MHKYSKIENSKLYTSVTKCKRKKSLNKAVLTTHRVSAILSNIHILIFVLKISFTSNVRQDIFYVTYIFFMSSIIAFFCGAPSIKRYVHHYENMVVFLI